MYYMVAQRWKLSHWRNKERVLGQELGIRVRASEEAEDAMEKDRDGLLMLFILSHFDYYSKYHRLSSLYKQKFVSQF